MKDETLKVAGVRRFSPGVFELQLERDGLSFVPGDCMALYAEDGRVSRPYSIASGTAEPVLRFLIRRMEVGAVSPYLAARTAGDLVRVSPPFGWFRPGERGGRFVFIATGTGIAPFFAHFRSRTNARPEALLYGVRTLADAVDVEYLKSVCDLRLTISREKVDGVHYGRVADLLDAVPIGADVDYYLCGLDTMIDDVTKWLEGRGISITRIHRECFFNASYDAAR